MSDHNLSMQYAHKTQAFDAIMSYNNMYNLEMTEDLSDLNIQTFERNYLKLFGIVL